MKQLYLVRHGEADYESGRLTNTGKRQVQGLSEELTERLPIGKAYSIVSSPTRRAYETARILLPLFRSRTGSQVSITRDSGFGQEYSNGSDEYMFRLGKERVQVLENYGKTCDILFLVSHEGIIAATGIAIAEGANINLPDNFSRIKEYTEENVQDAISKFNLPRERVVQRLEESYPDSLPRVGEATAVLFDFDKGLAEVISPLLR